MKKIINKLRIDSRIRVGYGTAFFLLLLSYIITLYANRQFYRQTLLSSASNELQARFNVLNLIIIISLLLAFSMVIFGFFTYIRENKARRMADKKADEYHEQLEQRIEQLAGANKELIQMRSIEKFAATGRIARTIAHEVRNPLTNINLAIEQIKSDLPQQAGDQGVLFDMVTRNSNRINQLITDLLNSTKFSELDYKAISLCGIMDEALELAKDRILLNNVNVERNYINKVCLVFADAEKLRIAFLNIIVNAIEAMEKGKAILKVCLKQQDAKYVITIADNGSGMDSDALSRVFEPYFTSKSKGTGLGLTNSQNIILNHKGSITVESEVKAGTVFNITLDVANQVV
jgi:signal transduction histidine kinase